MMQSKKLFKKYRSLLYTAETGIKPLDWLIDFVYDKYRSCLGKYQAIKRSIFWAKKMHKSYDFDGQTVYEMLYYKLDRMEKCMSEYGHCVWNSCPEDPEYDLMVKLRRARDLAKNLSEKDPYNYLNKLQKAHDEKWGKPKSNLFNYSPEDVDSNGNITMRTWRKNANTDEEKAQERKEQKIIWKKQNEAYLDEMIEFHELLKYNLADWWD